MGLKEFSLGGLAGAGLLSLGLLQGCLDPFAGCRSDEDARKFQPYVINQTSNSLLITTRSILNICPAICDI